MGRKVHYSVFFDHAVWLRGRLREYSACGLRVGKVPRIRKRRRPFTDNAGDVTCRNCLEKMASRVERSLEAQGDHPPPPPVGSVFYGVATGRIQVSVDGKWEFL